MSISNFLVAEPIPDEQSIDTWSNYTLKILIELEIKLVGKSELSKSIFLYWLIL